MPRVWLDSEQQQQLREIAHAAIQSGFDGQPQPLLNLTLPPALQDKAASFVTLKLHAELRGCVGTVEAWRPLASDVSANAHAAAFDDPRFSPLSLAEWADCQLSISILGAARPLVFRNEDELLQQLEPGQDGLILRCGRLHATFLPQVWQQLPRPDAFVRHLKIKAGLAEDFWSDDMQALIYQTQTF